MAVQKDDKILVGGVTSIFENVFVVAISRLKDDGTLDSTFGVNGTYIDTSNKSERAIDIVVQADGKIVTCGDIDDNADIGTFQTLFLRLNTEGSRDDSFGIDGRAIIKNSFFSPRSIVQQQDGKLVSAGSVDGGAMRLYFV